MAMRTTSSGMVTIRLPLRLNITTMVKSSATSVIGLIFGTKLSVVPVLGHEAQQITRVENAGDAGNAQIDENALGDLADARYRRRDRTGRIAAAGR